MQEHSLHQAQYPKLPWQRPRNAIHASTVSFFTGWFITLAWQAGNAQGIFLTGILIQTLIAINDVAYPFPNWQGTLLGLPLQLWFSSLTFPAITGYRTCRTSYLHYRFHYTCVL